MVDTTPGSAHSARSYSQQLSLGKRMETVQNLPGPLKTHYLENYTSYHRGLCERLHVYWAQ